MKRKFLRVAKVGGSLFDFPNLPVTLRCWLDSQPGTNILIAGGGPFAETIREADETFAIGDAMAHQLALEAMSMSARLLATLLPDTPLVHDLAAVDERMLDRTTIVLDPQNALKSPACQLPHTWDVTSDSIAAYLADTLGAEELVLFKSISLPANMNRTQAAEAGFIDAHFVEASPTLPHVRWVNLRSAPVGERPLPR